MQRVTDSACVPGVIFLKTFRKNIQGDLVMFPLVRHVSLHLVNSLISKLLHELWQNRARVSLAKPFYLRRTKKGKFSESIERSHFCPIQAVKQTAECPSWLFFVVPWNVLGSIHLSPASLQGCENTPSPATTPTNS